MAIKTRKYKCIGCGNGRPCFFESNQEKSNIDFYDEIEGLKCILDETNQTSYNWEEVIGADTSDIPIHYVTEVLTIGKVTRIGLACKRPYKDPLMLRSGLKSKTTCLDCLKAIKERDAS